MEHHINIGKLFCYIHQTASVNAECTLALHIGELQTGHKRILCIRSCYGKHIALCREQEIIKNRERILGVYHFAHTRKGGI